MITNTLKTLFKRDLNKLIVEVELYQDEANIWKVDKDISNSAGNLCLHLVGNLNAFIGAALAGTNYVRQRDLEFSQKDVPRTTLIQEIKATIVVVENALDSLDAAQMTADFPIMIWGHPTEMEYTLVHLLTHLNYHLGQVNYHRRLLDH